MESITLIPYRNFVFPIGLLVSSISVFIAANFAEHIEEGLVAVPLYLHIPFQIGIPLVTTVILLIKVRRRKGEKKHEGLDNVVQSEN
jgi:spore germination protein KB